MKPKTTLLATCGLAAIVGTLFVGIRAHASPQDPLISYHVGINPDGMPPSIANEADVIGSENDVVEVRSGSDARIVQKSPGQLKVMNVLVKRGVTNDLTWYRWRKQVEDGNITAARKDTTLTIFDSRGTVVSTMKLTRAWPSALKMSSATAVEEMTIACEGWSRQ